MFQSQKNSTTPHAWNSFKVLLRTWKVLESGVAVGLI